MKQEPYSIYIDKRPIRIAFLINPKKDAIMQIQLVIEYNIHKWGGRYNPIIFTDGKKIKKNWWNLLCNIDPDIIISFIQLDKELVKKIDFFINPISLEIKNPLHNNIHSIYKGLSIHPTIENINKLFSSTLVLFDKDKDLDTFIKQFININFGSYPINLKDIHKLDDNNKKIFNIKKKEELISALKDLSIYNNFAYPIQICSIPYKFREVKYSGVESPFTIIVGDSPEDIVYNWNISLSYPEWQKKYFNNIWLSVDLSNDIEFGEVLKKWLKTICWNSSRSNHRIRFISFSLSKDELKVISDRLTKNVLSNITETYNEIKTPEFQQRSNFVSITNEMDSFQVTGDQNQIIINPPDIEKSFMIGESWVADIFIQHHPERYPNFQGRTLWWRLPKHNMLAYRIFNGSSRICSNGFPSVLLAHDVQNLKINLISDSEIFRILLTDENKAFIKADARYNLNHRRLSYIKPSNTGKYMSGFINLFGNLFIAKQYIEIRYWRHMFDILSNVNPKKDDRKKEEIKNALSKKGINFLKSEEDLTWLTEYVLNRSKDIVNLNKEITWSIFKKEARKECSAFNSNIKNKKLGYKNKHFIENLKKTLSELIKQNILQIGLQPQCPSCGLSEWYHIDEIQQDIICKGCRSGFNIAPEEKWFYKLNSLVRFGYSQQGLTPVILTLGQLFEECNTSFIYETSQDVFKFGEKEHFTDLDIICIQDGKLIIGEIKQSIKGFKNKDFTSMKKVAEIIRPNKIIFSSLDNNCNKNIESKINKLREDLELLEIEVEWFQLRQDIFGSTPFL